jgi:hypothetical protein
MSGSNAPQPAIDASRSVELELDVFGREMLESQCAELGVSEGELVRFALLYYLADIDSGRIARSIPKASSAHDGSESR